MAAAAILSIGRRSVNRYARVRESVRRLIAMMMKYGIPREFA